MILKSTVACLCGHSRARTDSSPAPASHTGDMAVGDSVVQLRSSATSLTDLNSSLKLVTFLLTEWFTVQTICTDNSPCRTPTSFWEPGIMLSARQSLPSIQPSVRTNYALASSPQQSSLTGNYFNHAVISCCRDNQEHLQFFFLFPWTSPHVLCPFCLWRFCFVSFATIKSQSWL